MKADRAGMSRRELSKAILRASGTALMLLGAVHLIATPEIPHLLDGLAPKARDFALGPTLLNHVLVGLLLMPLGFTTWMAAEAWYRGEAWSRPVLLVNSLVVFALPMTLVLFVGRPEYYRAPIFLAGVALTALAALSIPIAILIGTSTPSRRG
jgi:hypothetical protein